HGSSGYCSRNSCDTRLAASPTISRFRMTASCINFELKNRIYHLEYKIQYFLYTLKYALNKHHHLRSEEHTSELQSRFDLVCRLLLEKKKKTTLHKRIRDSKKA